jgi:hypothetical protein
MPTQIKTFTYTGTTQVLTIPAGTTSMDVYLWGSGGGGGGGDQSGPGQVGAGGHFVSATSIALSAYANQVMRVAVGGGGAGGTTHAGGAAGGANGKSLTGYSGGRGGSAGPRGASGAGGGGGGATVITINGAEIAIAGGGGAGGSDGRDGRGSAGINANSATTNSPGTLGENGADHTGDGGGGGAGGGGANGGKGGSGGSGDVGGAGGYSGSNLVPGGGSEELSSGQTPGGTGNAYYQSNAGRGGGVQASGANGLAVIIFTISPDAYTNVGGDWKRITDVYTKVSGRWKRITGAFAKIGSTWKPIYNSGIDFTETAAGFGDNVGTASSGTPGSGGGGGGRVICTWLQNKGLFSLEDLKVDTEYSVKYISRNTKIGYWFWAVPLVNYMTRAEENNSKFGKLVIRVIRALAQARANELAYAMGVKQKRDILGIFTRLIGESFCWTVGVIVRPFVEHKFADWLEIYDPEIR